MSTSAYHATVKDLGVGELHTIYTQCVAELGRLDMKDLVGEI